MWPWQQRLISSLKSKRYQKVFETVTGLLNMTGCVDEWIKRLVCKKTKTKHVFMEITVLHDYCSVHRSKHNRSHQCQTKHTPCSLRCRLNLLESLKEIYFLHYPHFPLSCCVFHSLHTALANHIFGTARMFHRSFLQRQRRHSVVKQSECIYYIHQPQLLSALHSTPLSYNTMWERSPCKPSCMTQHQRCTVKGSAPFLL